MGLRNTVPIRRQPKFVDGKNLDVIILTAGAGKKTRTYGNRSLFRISNNKTILQQQISQCNSLYPDCNINVVVGFEADKVVESILPYARHNHRVRFTENSSFDTLNVTKSINAGLRLCTREYVLIIYGDLIFSRPTIDKLPLQSWTLSSFNLMGENEIGINVSDETAQHFVYGVDNKWCQIILLTGEELEACYNISSKKEHQMWCASEVFNKMIDAGAKILVQDRPNIKIFEIDCIKNFFVKNSTNKYVQAVCAFE